MKTRIVLLSVITSFMAFSALAQAIESDDMYFNKKDRVKLRAQNSVDETYVPYAQNSKLTKNNDPVYARNTVYSARNVNPEYAARSNAQAAQTDNQDYFVANYQYKTAPANNLNQFNNNLNNWYNNPMYRSAYMGAAMYGWNSPYYGMNSMYSSPWYDPYYSNNGFSSSFSFYYGNTYNYGWGGNYNYWNQPYCGGSPWGMGMGTGLSYNYGYGGYNNYYGYGGYNGYSYSPNVIIVNNNGEHGKGVTYGKRPSSGGIVSSQHNTSARTRNDNVVSNNNTGGGRSYTGGRTSSSSSNQSDYYNRSWRNAQQVQTNYNNSSNNNWNRQQNNSFDFNRTNSGNTRSNSFDNGGGSSGGGMRTHSPASTGGGSGGRSRGRD